jgi:pimeloyl-ACP methyl ester carboxylesterase
MFLKFIKSLIVTSIILCSIIIIILWYLYIMSPYFSHISSIIIKIIIGFVIFLFLSLRWLDRYMSVQNNDSNLLKKLQHLDPQASLDYYTNTSGYVLRYATLWNPSQPTLLFLHGTPGSISDAFSFLKKTDVLTHYHVIVPDRPGFGGSMKGNEMPTIKEQWELLSELLFLSGNSEKITLVWWSYAGALFPYIASQYNNKIESMVIVAGTMDPDHQTIWKISYPLHYTWLKYIIPSLLRVTNSEKLASRDQLTSISWVREDITIPVWLIHGKKDRIVNIENTYFAEKKLINSKKVIVTIIDDSGHEIPITKPQSIIDLLEELKK